MEPIVVEFEDDKGKHWGLWVASDQGRAVVLPKNGKDQVKPVFVDLTRVKVLAGQNEHLNLDLPKT